MIYKYCLHPSFVVSDLVYVDSRHPECTCVFSEVEFQIECAEQL